MNQPAPGSRLVGRDDELSMLSSLLEEAVAGRGRLVVIGGDAGIGKTRLCEELGRIAGRRGVGVAWAACWESGGVPPYWPWRQLLDQIGASLDTPSAAEVGDAARAELFSAVIGAVRGAAAGQPWLLVLDDAQWADPGTLRLVAFAAPLLRTVPVLMVVTSREDGRTDAGGAELSRQGRVVRLDGLDSNALAELVEELTGTHASAGVSDALRRATAGNPLFASELVRQLHRAGHLDRLAGHGEAIPVPPTVRAVLAQQLDELSVDTRELLAIASVAGREFSIDLVAEVAGLDRLDVVGSLDEAVAARVVAPFGVGTYAFAHPLLRSAIHDGIAVARRVRLHERIGDALEAALASGHQVDLASLSFHYVNAAPGGTAAKAVIYAEQAALQAMAALGYEDAVALYDRALAANELVGSAPDRVRLLLGAGRARAAAGDSTGARDVLLRAAELARRDGSPIDLANAALSLSGSGFEVALSDDEQIRLLEEALELLADEQLGLRSRLSARLSVALSLAGQEARRVALAEAAVRLAGDGDDGTALAGALAARCDVQAGPADIDARAADATEIVRIGRELGDRGIELLGRRLRLLALLEAGDIDTADVEVDRFAQVADPLGQAHYQWYVPMWRAMRAAMRGQIVEQQRLADEAEQLGQRAQSVNTAILITAQRWFTWVEIGDVETAVTEFERRMPPGARGELGMQIVPTYVLHRLLAGRREEARAMLDRAADDLRNLDRDSEWLPAMVQLTDAFTQLGGHPLVEWVYDALTPFGQRWAIEGIGAYTHGSVHRHLGQLAALLGRPDAAAAHFDAAVIENRRAGADLLVARTLLDRGVALHEPDSLRAAQDAYRALGVEHRVAEIDAIVGATAPSGDNVFRQSGDVWIMSFAGREVRARDSKGIRDIAVLLQRPGREVAALDLAAPGSTVGRGDLGETVDAQAREAYKNRLVELETELDEADTTGDAERSARLQAERDALLQQLSSAYGLAGRPRRTGDPAERARTAVTARIRDAIRRLETIHPELGRHLARSVRTGTLCTYDPDQPIRWQL